LQKIRVVVLGWLVLQVGQDLGVVVAAQQLGRRGVEEHLAQPCLRLRRAGRRLAAELQHGALHREHAGDACHLHARGGPQIPARRLSRTTIAASPPARGGLTPAPAGEAAVLAQSS
jgi:hypothetical protein